MLKREMKFNRSIISDVVANFMKGAVAIVLALLGYGVWSLVWAQVLSVLSASVTSWIVAGWRPTWRFQPEVTRSIFTFGFHIILLETAGALRTNMDYLFVGRILGAAALGYYTMAYRIPELLIRSLNYGLGNVSLPALAISKTDPVKMRNFYFGYIRFLSMFVFPVGVGLAFTAPVFIPLFLSEKWGPAIVPTALISIALGIAALGHVPGLLYKAIGRPDILNKLAWIKMPIAGLILWYSTRWGIVGVATAQIVIGLISVSIDSLTANHVMHYTLPDLIKSISPAFISTLSMTAVLLIIRNGLSFDGLIQFVLMVVVGALTYFGVLWFVGRETLIQGVGIVRSTLKKRSAPKIIEQNSDLTAGTRVSAIITAYNSEAYIAEAINSVLNQSRVVDEIVVVDDGSTDSTRQIVQEFADRGIKYVLQPNQGAGAARNRGIKETTGEYIAFLDADDLWLEDKTQRQLNYLSAHPETAMVSGSARWWNVTKNTVRIFGKVVPRDMNSLRRELLVYNVFGNPSMVMLRRSALVEVGLFNENIRWGQDWDLWIRIAERYGVAVLPELVTIYRWHKDNLSQSPSWERELSLWNVSRNAIWRSKPAWQRIWLLARSWSNYTYRHALHAMQSAFPRWRQVGYALLAFLIYPFEMTREKFGAVIRSVVGDHMYQAGKRVFRSRMSARGPE
jgi:glycosyltransferase involved in cell wall biosynthesis/O-antigen/teichoic acid export membrane protein